MPACAPVTAAVRLAYVLRHFWLVYEEEPEISIGYADNEPAVLVADAAESFFETNKPFPTAPNWREWRGHAVPFFFDAAPVETLLKPGDGTAYIAADIVSAAFYLLSGWQEYFSDARDRHGRFPYAASVQKEYGFVTMPVVNYYFDVLKTAVEHVTGQPLKIRPWREGAPFAAFISHDIDNLRSAWKAPAKAALKQGQVLRFAQLLRRHLTQADAWDNLEVVAAETAKYGGKSTFFILPEHRPGEDGTPNADYKVSPKLWHRLENLEQEGCEIGLHGSIGTATSARRLATEGEDFVTVIPGLRFHYLRWEPRQTPAVIDAAQRFHYDSTLGFAEHFGFRHSFCHPFFPFNFATGEAHSFLEIPLNVMDATLHHPNYLQLRADEILPALQPMLSQIERFGGVVSVLWHNENFDLANTSNGPREFAAIMEDLQQRGAAFMTGSELVEAART
ncbi:MAG: hypothetical protein JWR44_3504 [Hymenobacter sp.]|jgi:hypothetical protein|nr:hypothetical protein [Hymenobacter sp.]